MFNHLNGLSTGKKLLFGLSVLLSLGVTFAVLNLTWLFIQALTVEIFKAHWVATIACLLLCSVQLLWIYEYVSTRSRPHLIAAVIAGGFEIALILINFNVSGTSSPFSGLIFNYVFVIAVASQVWTDGSSHGESIQSDSAQQPEEHRRVRARIEPEERTQNVQSSSTIKYKAKRSMYNFDSILGMRDLKERLVSFVSVANLGGNDKNESGINRNGVLLFGPPGNGKTMVAHAIAGQLGIPIVEVTFGDLANSFINRTSENIVKVFQDAINQAPCVLFFDEINTLIKNPKLILNSHIEAEQIVDLMLTELTRAATSGVIVVGATNKLEELDPRAIREGRWDLKLEVKTPDVEARHGLLQRSLQKNVPQLESDLDAVFSMALRWEGFSVKRILAVGEEIATMLKEMEIEKVDSKVLGIAMRRIQGRKGKLPESAKNLSELILEPSVKKQLTGLAYSLSDIEDYESKGGVVPKGILFYGPPGTGKTSTAMALAKESGYAFLSTTGRQLMKSEELDKLVQEALDIRPTIIFIDEASDILTDRTYSSVDIATNALLAAMDGTGGRIKDVLWIAAVNNIERIDPAAVRGGRFSEKVLMDLPTEEMLADYIEEWITEKTRANFGQYTGYEIAQIIGERISLANAEAILQAAANNMVTRSREDQLSEVIEVDLVLAINSVLFRQK